MQVHWQKGEVPQPPFYAVLFLSRKRQNPEGYEEMDAQLMKVVQEQPGFLGYSSAGREENTFISYWRDEASIAGWQAHPLHREAKQRASAWYLYYYSMVSRVEHLGSFEAPDQTIKSAKR